MNQPLRIVFAGTPAFGLSSLKALAQSQHELIAVYTQPDRPSGRGRKLQASAIKEWAVEAAVPVYQPLNFKTPEAVATLESLRPDVLVVIAYGLILPKSVLTIPTFGCINVHASILPRWRGASPIQHAVLHGDSSSGVTVMQMDVGMDTGDMLAIAQCDIGPEDTAGTLHDRLAELSVRPLLEVLNSLPDRLKPQAQDNQLATYAGKINKEDALIAWNQDALKLDRQVRAFNPWPIAYTLLNEEALRIYKAQPVDLETQELPGTVLKIDKNGMLVATGHGCLLVKTIQFPGAKPVSIADWANSGKTTLYPGLRFL